MVKLIKLILLNGLVLFLLLTTTDLLLRFTPMVQVLKQTQFPDNYFINDDKLGIIPVKNYPETPFLFKGPSLQIHANELGCFDGPVILSPGEPYIIAIGDSFTWGYARLEDKWTTRLEEDLGIRVLKCGVTGTGSKYQLKFLKRLMEQLPHPPKLVIQLYTNNDFNDDFAFPGYRIVDGQRTRNFKRINLMTGERVEAPVGWSTYMVKNQREIRENRNFLNKHSVIYNFYKFHKNRLRQQKSAFSLKNGENAQHLIFRYQYNLLLADPGTYPLVAKRLVGHFSTIEETASYVASLNSQYALASVRLNFFAKGVTGDQFPLVESLHAFLSDKSYYLGDAPEHNGDRYQFDGHWNAHGNQVYGDYLIDIIQSRYDVNDDFKRSK